MKASREYEEKARRALKSKISLTHETWSENILPILEFGLMSRNEAQSRGLMPRLGGYASPRISYFPDEISFHNHSRNVLYRELNITASNPCLIIDEKYAGISRKSREFHPVYSGIIPPRDILAVIKRVDMIDRYGNLVFDDKKRRTPSFEVIENLMELQRDLPEENLVPVFFGKGVYDIIERETQLYVPDWLEISPGLISEVRTSDLAVC